MSIIKVVRKTVEFTLTRYERVKPTFNALRE